MRRFSLSRVQALKAASDVEQKRLQREHLSVAEISRRLLLEHLLWAESERPRELPSRPGHFSPSTGWPEVVAHLRLPQNVACGFPALRSSKVASQRGESL